MGRGVLQVMGKITSAEAEHNRAKNGLFQS
jgi:hypothetical protein